MKSSAKPQSATSLPRAPRDEASARSTRYLILMTIRIVCFALMVLLTPYGWYTWLFGAGAIFLPYFAVIFANVGQGDKEVHAVQPERTLGTTPPPPAEHVADDAPVIRIEEIKHLDAPLRAPAETEPGETS